MTDLSSFDGMLKRHYPAHSIDWQRIRRVWELEDRYLEALCEPDKRKRRRLKRKRGREYEAVLGKRRRWRMCRGCLRWWLSTYRVPSTSDTLRSP